METALHCAAMPMPVCVVLDGSRYYRSRANSGMLPPPPLAVQATLHGCVSLLAAAATGAAVDVQ